jgi:hypothetical protein
MSLPYLVVKYYSLKPTDRISDIYKSTGRDYVSIEEFISFFPPKEVSFHGKETY